MSDGKGTAAAYKADYTDKIIDAAAAAGLFYLAQRQRLDSRVKTAAAVVGYVWVGPYLNDMYQGNKGGSPNLDIAFVASTAISAGLGYFAARYARLHSSSGCSCLECRSGLCGRLSWSNDKWKRKKRNGN